MKQNSYSNLTKIRWQIVANFHNAMNLILAILQKCMKDSIMMHKSKYNKKLKRSKRRKRQKKENRYQKREHLNIIRLFFHRVNLF